MQPATAPPRSAFEAARERLRGVVRHTPLVPFDAPGGARGLFLKLETLQPVGSFKIRGVFHRVARMTADERARGISTVSAGNTAHALAFAGRHFGVPARSLMPEGAPQTKVDAVRAFGATPVLVPTAEVFRYLKEEGWKDEPYAYVDPWRDPDVHAGHGTLALEILEDCPDVDTVYVPVGGGGLLAGVGSALKAFRPEVRVVAVEPEGCPSLFASLAAGRPMEVECKTICDGVAVPYVSPEMYPLLAELAERVVLVSEDEVRAMVRHLALVGKVVAEPSGALAAAAALKEARDALHATRAAVCLVTGASIDARKLAGILTDS